MPHHAISLVPRTIKLTAEQSEACTQLPEGVTLSNLCRVLLDLYLRNEIPEAHVLIIKDVQESSRRKQQGKFSKGENSDVRRARSTTPRS